jgi:hypothetical protein
MKLKIYSHTDYGNAILPRDVLEALTESRWTRQGHLYIWATTAKAAAARLAELGLGTNSPRDLRVCDDHGTVATLNAAHNWADGTVLAVRLSGGGPVVWITDHPDRTVLDEPRLLRTVGELRHGIALHLAADLQPAVTDAMVSAALDVLASSIPDGTQVGWLLGGMRPAIAAALNAQRTGS